MLVVLEVVAGAEIGRLIKIRQDQTCKIGRTNWADEVFSEDVMMSGQHFEIQNDGKYCWLRDLESRNGTRVDDDFVKENLILHDGQSVQAGRTQFIVRIDGGAKSPYESTSYGKFEPVKNPALMSMQFGGPPVPESPADLRFASPAAPNAPPQAEIPSAAPEPPLPASLPGNRGADLGGNIELPSRDTPHFPVAKTGIPPAGPATPPGANNPPWSPPEPPSQLVSEEPGTPHPGPHPVPFGKAGSPLSHGGDAPVFKFAKVPLPPGPAVANRPEARSEGPPGLISPSKPIAGPPPFTPTPIESSPLPNFPSEKLPPATPGSPPSFLGSGGFKGAINPNLDLGPGLDFGDEPAESPPFGPAEFAGPSGPAFIPPQSPGHINPNLIGISDDDASGLDRSGSNWRSPDYLSPTPVESSAPPQSEVTASKTVAPSVHGICFREETTAAGYPVYRSIFEGVPQVPFSPFGLVSAVSRIAQPVLAIHFLRAERPIPEGLEGIPLRGDLDPKFAPLGGPMLYAPKDLQPFHAIIDELWGTDAISCFFTSGESHAIIDHFRQGLFGPRRGDLPSAGPGPQFFAVFSPNLLTTFLASRDRGTVDELLGTTIDGVLTEIADMPDSWQLYTRKPWAQQLKQLGMNRVVSQPQTV